MKVLIVDDEKLIRDVIKEYCIKSGYGVLEAENGNDAVEKAKEANIIVMDIMMPKMDGYSAYKIIKEKDIKYIWNKYYHNEKKHKRNAIGTGLGLSIVKTILDGHNYKYGVKSVKGKGSTFFFEIDNKNVL